MSRKKKEKYYLLSTGRTSTKFIASHLVDIKGKKNNFHQRDFSRIVNIKSNISLFYNNYRPQFLNYYCSLFEDYLPQSTCDPLQSIALYQYILDNNNSNIKIIHIIRDPRDFITSLTNWKNRKISGIIAHHFLPFWHPIPNISIKTAIIDQLNCNKIDQFAKVWTYKNELFGTLENKCKNYRLFKFEDITSSKNVLLELLNYLEVSNIPANRLINNKLVSNKNSKPFPYWRNWKKKEANMVDYYCGELIVLLRLTSLSIFFKNLTINLICIFGVKLNLINLTLTQT